MKNVLKKIIAYALIIGELLPTSGVYALTKEENVYAKLSENGKEESVLISEHLFDFSDKVLKDYSNLTDIKNINGNESYVQNGNELVWKTNGNDIYYQGSYGKELPIALNVKYYLNDEEKNVDDILGKKGTIKIVLSYSNNKCEDRYINGKLEKICVPYAIFTTSILNNKNNKNIKVTNGKIINNGQSSVIVSVASPGLYESLKLEELKSIDKIEISYDTDDFELSSIYSIASTDLFGSYDFNALDNMNDLYNKISLLQSNMNSIVKASKELSDGSVQMDAGITELNSKIQGIVKEYYYYRNQDKDVLKEKIIEEIEKHLVDIIPALEEEIANEAGKIVRENKKELEQAVILSTKQNTKDVINDEISKIINNLDVKNLIAKTIDSNLYNLLKNDSKISELSNIFKDNINRELKTIITNKINEFTNNLNVNTDKKENEKYVSDIAKKYGITYEQAKGIVNDVQNDTINQVKRNISNTDISDQIIKVLNNNEYISNLVNTFIQELNTKISSSLNSNQKLSDYSNDFKHEILLAINKDLDNNLTYLKNNGQNYLNEVVNKIIDNSANDISKKYTQDYTNQVIRNVIEKEFDSNNMDSKLRKIIDEYEDDINQKASSLDEAINTLSNALSQLNTGSKKMSGGLNALYQGLNMYNEEGINRINNIVNSDVKTFQQRFNALKQLSKENIMIDSTPDNAKNSSKIIFLIDSKTKPNEVPPIIKNEEKKKSFLDKIVGLFN